MKYLLFDLDGTITDSFDSVANSFIYALSHYGIVVKNPSDLRPALGPPLKDTFMNMFGFDEETAIEAVEKYRERYVNFYTVENKLYMGIADVLSALYDIGYKLVLATSKPEEYARNILKYFNIDKYFFYIAGATFDKKRNEKIDILKHIFTELDLPFGSNEVVMIGDRKYDLEAAEQMGIAAIGVLYGYGDYEELKNYPNIFLAETPQMLYNYLRGEKS